MSADLFIVYSEDGTRTVFSIRFTLYLSFWLLKCDPVYVEKLGKAPHALHPTGLVVDIFLFFYFLLYIVNIINIYNNETKRIWDNN